MKNALTLMLLLCMISFTRAQLSHTTYENNATGSKLILSANGYFQYKTFDGMFYQYLRGKWSMENQNLILSESYFGEQSENKHFIYKAPKFEYTIGKRRTTLKINENQLILTHQEIMPPNAGFQANLDEQFLLIKE